MNIGPEDIVDGNAKLVLGLIWTIIYHYQIAAAFKNAPSANAKKNSAKDIKYTSPHALKMGNHMLPAWM